MGVDCAEPVVEVVLLQSNILVVVVRTTQVSIDFHCWRETNLIYQAPYEIFFFNPKTSYVNFFCALRCDGFYRKAFSLATKMPD